MSAHDHHHPSDHQPHLLPLSVYFGVAGGLIILTVLTVYTAKFMPEHIYMLTKMQITPVLSMTIAFIIASIKALLVAAFFMHLKYDEPFNRVALTSSLVFVAFFFIFTLGDMLTRDQAKNESYIKPTTPKAFQELTEVSRYYPEKFAKEGRKITKLRNGIYLVGTREGYTKDGYKIGEDKH